MLKTFDDDKFGVAGAKIGNTLNIRKPPRYIGREGQQMQIEGITETSVPLVLEKQFGVDISFSSQDLALNIDDFSKRILYPAIAVVANKIDNYMATSYQDIPNFVGTPGVTPTALLTYLQASQKMDEEATPMDDLRTMVVNPAAMVNMVDQLKGLFQQASAIGEQYKTGRMGRVIGFEWIMDQNIRTHTVGALGGTPLVNGANQTGSTLNTDGWTATTGALKKGDVLTLASVNSVNPMSKDSTGALRDIVVTADTTADGSGNMATIPIYPSLQSSGAFQNIDATAADNAIIKIFGHASTYASTQTPANLAFHRECMALACADLPLPGGVDKAARVSDDQLGISLRMVRDYTIDNDQFPCRIDVLVGRVTQYQELACRVQG